MSKKADILVFVESPGKTKTIQGFLGPQYIVESTVGHIRQIASKNGSVTFQDGFIFQWEDDDSKIKKIVSAIKKNQPKEIILATDCDREGAAISWHVKNLIKEIKYDKAKISRITFNEITEKAIKDSLENKGDIDLNLVNAYLTRAGFDYRLGYGLSQELWKKIICYRKNQSAGRVQSWALKVIVNRENERINFIKEKYYTLSVFLEINKNKIEAILSHINKKKLERILDRKELEKISIPKTLIVKEIKKKIVKINPPAPFITSTLQQAASTRLKIDISYIMKIAQDLYEGIEIEGKRVGLITYMRTDSTTTSKDAISMIRKFIKKNYEKHLPEKPNIYKTKIKNAQEAHECIRPTQVEINPEKIKNSLSDIHFKVYDMIWRRTVASQMKNAENEVLSVVFEDKELRFRSSFSRLSYNGYLEVYDEEIEESNNIPNIKEKEIFEVISSKINDHETQPPGRYSEASLIKEMEKYSVGRPSTYPTIIESIKKREYVRMKNKFFEPTLKGKIAYYFLESFFKEYVELNFTSKIEEFLDEIAKGKINYEKTLKGFIDHLDREIENVQKVSIIDVITSISDLFTKFQKTQCEKCQEKMTLRMKNNPYLSCPKCNSIQQIDTEKKQIGEVQFIKTEKYAMIKKSDGTNLYLPANFKEEMNEDKVNYALSLPKEIDVIDNVPVIGGISKYGLYLKYKDKYLSISSIEGLMNLKKEHTGIIPKLIEEKVINFESKEIKLERIGFSIKENKDSKKENIRYFDKLFFKESV